MKCSDIPDKPILEFIMKHNDIGKTKNLVGWCNWYFGDERDVHHVFPDGVDDNLLLAKMRGLMKRGLIDGCDCGCRGDYVITAKGRMILGESGKPNIYERLSKAIKEKV